jgi:diguanylate cyclase (GGDEF)-like protein
VLKASNGREALKQLANNPAIKLILTDHNMPVMDGFELVQTLRHKLNNIDLDIIGLSSDKEKRLSARFIKNGANDFLVKPFSHEEFYCRVMQVVNAREQYEDMKRAAYFDALTGLSNRRFLYEQGNELFKSAQDGNQVLAVAILDIDHFKQINDNFGHQSGDIVLQALAATMKETLSEHGYVYRTGGEEFTILLPGASQESAASLLNTMRQEIESEAVTTDQGDISYTISLGLTTLLSDTLDHTLTRADEHLYRAKNAGRNMLIGDD